MFDGASEIKLTPECKDWYDHLSPEKKAFAKGEAFFSMCGVDFEALGVLFTEEERIQILYNKLTGKYNV